MIPSDLMKQIWKFPLTIGQENTVAMPAGSRILFLSTQHDVPTLWAEVDVPVGAVVDRKLVIIPTGQPFDCTNLIYIDSFKVSMDTFVFHVYESVSNQETVAPV